MPEGTVAGAGAEARRKVEEGLRALYAWAARVKPGAVSAAVRRREALTLVDDLSAMVAAATEPEVRAIQALIAKRAGRGEASVLARGLPQADRVGVAFANGTAANWCELDAGFRRAMCHAHLYVVPAVSAEAEATGKTLGDVIRACLIGYEVVARFARAFRWDHVVVHPHAYFSPVGAAAGVAALRGYDAESFASAVNAAATYAQCGPFDHATKGVLVENSWAGTGAELGLRAADLAACGAGGSYSAPFTVYADALGARVEPGALTDNLGVAWEIESGYHKLHSCCQYAHATVDALLGMLPKLPRPLDPDRIRAIEVATFEMAQHLEAVEPPTTLSARFSIPHAAAATLVYGHAGPEAFGAASLRRNDVAALRRKVNLSVLEPPMPPPNDRPSAVTVTFTDGDQVLGECLSARGGPDKPFSEDEILAKVAALADPTFPGFGKVARRIVTGGTELDRKPYRAVLAMLTGALAGAKPKAKARPAAKPKATAKAAPKAKVKAKSRAKPAAKPRAKPKARPAAKKAPTRKAANSRRAKPARSAGRRAAARGKGRR